jgi:hypothetical protein
MDITVNNKKNTETDKRTLAREFSLCVLAAIQMKLVTFYFIIGTARP